MGLAHKIIEQKYKHYQNETELKMENPIHSFREMNNVVQLVQELQVNSKTAISWSSQKKKDCIFYNVYFVRRMFFFTFLFCLNV